jgi:hypothetical protein
VFKRLCRRARALTLGPEPLLALAEELPDLREQELRRRALAL